jgi:adenine phosphoribosyltransferase
MADISTEIKNTIRNIPDFPQPGIIFRDLTTLLEKPDIYLKIIDELAERARPLAPDALVALESRGFWFGLSVAARLQIPFIPIRKEGKLPGATIAQEYSLEYGNAKIEMHTDVLRPGWKVLLHDDLLATGGTAEAAGKLVTQQGASICGYSFLVELAVLEGRKKLLPYSHHIDVLTTYL